ncbi:hypothetical protein CPR19092_LGOLGGFK_01087 [Companilactobacillus paralimentarius]|uniref:hypothetical protein n=1 Tax=Companilactobacillus paralimentarius TaxID=83526 RepID=UPI00130283EB|nr:hypothetical protein [Companilactobacillus paralimentarius]KAE9563258.1 hypothetical protein ATN96_11090 [Companilactobacillus paralimentarius]
MTDIVQMSKDGAKFYPQTHAQAVLGLPDFSTFEKASDVQTAISSALGKVDVSQTMSMSIRNKLQNMNKEMGS